MSTDPLLDMALALAELGYNILPASPGTKAAWLKDWQNLASRDPGQIREWWAQQPRSNPGLVGGNGYGFVDVDPRNGGDVSVKRLDLMGKILPVTRTVLTPSGGYHLHYKTRRPWKTTASKIADGIDTRGVGGYVLGPGSQLPEGFYELEDAAVPVEFAPDWLEDELIIEDVPAVKEAPVYSESAAARAIEYLARLPAALKGSRGSSAYKAAAVLKDFGMPEEETYHMMRERFKTEPVMLSNELNDSVRHAYKYGTRAIGELAPEKCFEPAVPEEEASPGDLVDQVNKNYAHLMVGGHARAIRTGVDHNGARMVDFIHLDALRSHMANLKDGEGKNAFEGWLRSSKRRQFDGVAFAPGRELPGAFFNLWRGWNIQPLPKGVKPSARAQAALDAFLLHARTNIHGGEWIIGYGAHMVQRPEDKPLTTVVMRGGKGSGKSALADILGELVKPHYGTASNPSHITGNFNAHFESKIMFTLEEAFWGGAKAADSVLKTLTTSRSIRIERKGQDSFEIESFLRIFIIGNEKWLVPASHDERRYAIFDVELVTHKPLSKEARAFFQVMREGMEAGGYALLLRFLLDYDLSGFDVNEAPDTQALADQKEISGTPFQQWWRECLMEGAIVSSEFSSEWPTDVDKTILREAYGRYCASRRITGWLPTEVQFGKDLAAMCPSIQRDQKRREGSKAINIYRLPSLEVARAEWCKFIGHEVCW